MAYLYLKRLISILSNVLVKVESFIFPTDFLIFYFEVDFEVPIILGRPFLFIRHALDNMKKWKIKFRLNNEEAIFNTFRYKNMTSEIQTISAISCKVESVLEEQIQERLGIEALAPVIMNF